MESQKMVKQVVAKTAEKEVAHFVAKTASKTAAKSIAKAAGSPMLYVADVAEVGTKALTENVGMSERSSYIASKGASYGTAAVVGMAVGGPIGSVTAVGIQVTADVIAENIILDEIEGIGDELRKLNSVRQSKKYVKQMVQTYEDIMLPRWVNRNTVKRNSKKAVKTISRMLKPITKFW